MSGPVKRGARFSAVPGRAYRDLAMTPKLRDVLGAMAYYASQDGTCVVKVPTVGALLGTDERNLRGYLAKLVDLGYLERRSRYADDGRELAAGWRVLYDAELPPERDRAATPDTVMVDVDEVESDHQGEGGSDYQGPRGSEYQAPPGRDYQANNTVLSTTGPNGPPAAPAPPVQPLLEDGPVELALLDPSQQPPVQADPVSEAWSVYEDARRSVLGSRFRPAALTPVRRRLIAARLRSHGADQVMAALRGWTHDSWVCGDNPSRKVYGTLEFVLRVSSQGDHVERFATVAAEADAGTLPTPKDATAETGARGQAARLAALSAFAEGGDTPLQLGVGGAA
jgi:hypothetical protein